MSGSWGKKKQQQKHITYPLLLDRRNNSDEIANQTFIGTDNLEF
jgi:hypothetical protein